jgi:hypothetical protein
MKKYFPEGNCNICGAACRVIKHVTFSYWYCDGCKDEPQQVWLKTNPYPKGAKDGYVLKNDNDIVISEPGVYRIDYPNGGCEFYEHKDGHKELRFYREIVRATARIADSDMPSRVRLQCVAKTSEGAAPKRPGLRAISTPGDSVQGGQGEAGEQIVIDWDAYNYSTVGRSHCRTVYADIEGTLRYLDDGSEFIQHGKVPPTDEL